MSVGVCWCLFIHGGDKGVSGGRVGVSEGYLGGVGRYLSAIFWKLVAHRCVLGTQPLQ